MIDKELVIRQTQIIFHILGRRRLNNETDFSEVTQICSKHQIDIKDLKPVSGSFGKKIYIINHKLILRMSGSPMTIEQEKFNRVATLNFVPKLIHTGILIRETEPIYYILFTFLPGDDFVNVYPETNEEQQKQLGKNIADFLENLHELKGTHYDIGLYVAILPRFSGTWREGHQIYWNYLKQEAEILPLKPESIRVFESAFQFLQTSINVLDFQAGPRLLHNDLHPKNILLHQGKFSGVIDWECSQFGEADFELCHLVHWCLYPPGKEVDFRNFLRSLLKTSPIFFQVPNLAKRLTIYQIEHEIQQIIWNADHAESFRILRLIRWMKGGVDDLFKEIGI
jgi:serine/threonine protein kinase